MSDKIDEIAQELYNTWLARKEIQEKEDTLKQTILTLLEKTNTLKYTSDQFILELTTRTDYEVPTPQQLRQALGDVFAANYISEVVDKKARLDLPPNQQSKLFPIKQESRFITVRQRRELQEQDYLRYKQKEKT